MANLFNRTFDDISFADIEALVCNKIRESTVLEYKREFRANDAAKTVSAMANTYGGIVVYGISSDTASNEPCEIVGVQDNRLEDAIDSVCLDAITPPVFCETRYVTDPNGLRVFLVRVPQSDLTPHAIENNSVVYLKTMAQKRPLTERADLDRQGWLTDRRQRAVDIRKSFVPSAFGHMSELKCDLRENQYASDIAVFPLFPREQVIHYSQLFTFLADNLQEFDAKHHWSIRLANPEFFRDGLCQFIRMKPGFDCFLEFNAQGFLFIRLIRARDEKPFLIDFRNLAIDSFLVSRFCMQLLDAAGYLGSRVLHCSVQNIKGTMAVSEVHGYGAAKSWAGLECRIENMLALDKTLYHGSTDEFVRDTLSDFFGRLLFIYGVNQDNVKCGQSIVDDAMECERVRYDETTQKFVSREGAYTPLN